MRLTEARVADIRHDLIDAFDMCDHQQVFKT
jgi:hypothetical protein